MVFEMYFMFHKYFRGGWTPYSRVVGLIPHWAWFAFEALGNIINPNLPQYTQLQMSTNIVWKVAAMD